MNYCIDCKHYGRGEYGIIEVCLRHAVKPDIDPVDGYRFTLKDSRGLRGKFYRTCRSLRHSDKVCDEFEQYTRRWWQVWGKK